MHTPTIILRWLKHDDAASTSTLLSVPLLGDRPSYGCEAELLDMLVDGA